MAAIDMGAFALVTVEFLPAGLLSHLNRSIGSERAEFDLNSGGISRRRQTENTRVVTGKLADTFIAHFESGAADAAGVGHHQGSRLE